MNAETNNRFPLIIAAVCLLLMMAIELRSFGVASKMSRNWIRDVATAAETSRMAGSTKTPEQALPRVNPVYAEAPKVAQLTKQPVATAIAETPDHTFPQLAFDEEENGESLVSPASNATQFLPYRPAVEPAPQPPVIVQSPQSAQSAASAAQWQARMPQSSLDASPSQQTEGDINDAPGRVSKIQTDFLLPDHPALPTIALTDHELSILDSIETGRLPIELDQPALPTTALTDHELPILDSLDSAGLPSELPIAATPSDRQTAATPSDRRTAATPSDRQTAATPSDRRTASLPQPLLGKDEKPKFKKFGSTKKDQAKSKEKSSSDKEPGAKKSTSLSSSTNWKLAPTPRKGDRYKDDTPLTDQHSFFVEGAHGNFSPTPTLPGMGYDPLAQMNVYQGKQLHANQRPLLELGRPWYQLGPISEGSSFLGFHNHVNPQYVLFGDARSAIASNNAGGNSDTLLASQINLFHHFKFTSTERFVAGHSPLATGGNNTRYSFEDEELFFEGNANFNFAYFEGDIGALVGGATGKTLPFDLPFAAGIVPLVFQNGIWLEDEILGFAVTIPARNSPRFDISNMDITFFAGYDRLDSPAFEGDNSAARVMGVATFIDALNGHFEVDYAFLDDRTAADRSYHNIGVGYTRRYGRFLSNSTRVIVNAGQQSNSPGTADGVLLLSENSLITGFPSTVVPYLNMFAGFDRPQSVARNGNAGGILRNTGILFESDNLTGYPTLDATANDTFGFAVGLNLLADEFAQQLIVEAAMLGVMGDASDRNANGDQYGLGVRYQLPLTNSVLIRADAMVGFLRNDEDVRGARLEIRKKF